MKLSKESIEIIEKSEEEVKQKLQLHVVTVARCSVNDRLSLFGLSITNEDIFKSIFSEYTIKFLLPNTYTIPFNKVYKNCSLEINFKYFTYEHEIVIYYTYSYTEDGIQKTVADKHSYKGNSI